MSRLPRAQEYLKTGFAAEAAAAARYRAYAQAAEQAGRPRLAAAWLDLAAEKDRLAIVQFEAAGKVLGNVEALATALAEERYENQSLYPRMAREVDAETAAVFSGVIGAQEVHAQRLATLVERLRAAGGDLPA
ncbi:MAG TPA: hypothetical protein PKM64_08045 [Thermoanaerobaculia bacterium]|nr:hypothetical protein [Thermoanaerobaculia bacterium]